MKLKLQRRQLLQLLATTALAPAAVRAQDLRRYAVISLIGDEIVLVYAAATTGSRLNRNPHRALPDAEGSLDKVALFATGAAVEKTGASATLISVGPSSLHQQADSVVSEKEIALTEAMVQQIEQAQARHVLLLTKLRAPTRIALAEGYIGTGSLRGLGYYVDRHTALRVEPTGGTGRGLIAPYCYVQLTLADARTGQVLRQRAVHASRVYAVAASATESDPWSLQTPTEKAERLSQLLQRQLAAEIPALIAG